MRVLAFLAILLLATSVAGKKKKCKEEEEEENKAPWFCHEKACPEFTTLKTWGDFEIRRYHESTWAAVCIPNAYHEEALMWGLAELMQYVRGANDDEKELWGGTPWAHHVSLEPHHLEAWNATAGQEPAMDHLHKKVCVAYFLPKKYQGDKRPPRPDSEAVRIVRVPRWIGFVSQFDGFPTKFRMIFHYMRMVELLKLHHVPFNWRVAMSFVYDPPYAIKDRHNEVLVPARRLDDLFSDNALDLFSETKQVLAVKTTAMAAMEEEDILAAFGTEPTEQA